MNAPENRRFNKGPGVGPLPIGDFFTPEYYALEKERIFKKSWLRVGREKQIPSVGDYFVKELESCDTSLIIVRGSDNRIRAFHNMCSHRSNRVAYEKSGNTKGFKCSFHSWAYGLDGSLRAVPEEHLFPGLVKAENGLTEVACDIWEGFIFVNVDPKPAQTLREYLGEEIYNGYNGFFQRYEQIGRFSIVANVNWKIFMDAFVENYHFSTVHARSDSDIMNDREYPNGRIDAVRLYGKHRIVSVAANMAHEPTFAEGLSRTFKTGTTVGPDPKKKMKISDNPPQINPKALPDWLSDIMIISPMCSLQPLDNFYITQNYWPLSHDRTEWEFTLNVSALKTAAEDVAASYMRSRVRDVVREDLYNLHHVQSNLKSGAKKYQILGEMEAMVGICYKTVAEQIGYGW